MWKPGQILWALGFDYKINQVKIRGGPIDRDEAPDAYYDVYFTDARVYGSVLASCLFRTYKEALDKSIERRRNEKEYYKSKINTQEDLLRFMLERMQVESKIWDYPAIVAAKEKCGELFNIEIE